QVASRVLEIPHEYVHITETSTDKVPNTSATAASAGSDLNGMAVMNACQVIVDRLKPYKEANPKGKWKDWVHTAYFDRVSLSATGFYKTPDIGFNWDKNEGIPFNYYTFGTSCSEVEIDCLTGDHQVLRTDIVMDLGESLNPAIDVGQVEGGFVQGQGLFTLEETLFSPKGALFTRGPGWYKIPGFADIPIEFNVSLMKGVSNPRAIYSSKAVGEPPLFLAASIFFAIKDALVAARAESGKTDWFRLDSPATAERIRVAAADSIAEKRLHLRRLRAIIVKNFDLDGKITSSRGLKYKTDHFENVTGQTSLKHAQMTTALRKFYYNHLRPSAFSSAGKLQKASRVDEIKVNEWLTGQDAYTLYRSLRKGFPRNPYRKSRRPDICRLGQSAQSWITLLKYFVDASFIACQSSLRRVMEIVLSQKIP
ncbi:unnamed protein product, partial [Timema podura]|nr:unnamed protein product [Timema podura]